MASSPLKTHGGKHYLAKRIVDMMPEHTVYLEAFGGGLSVLMRKPCEGISEYANDTNKGLQNFWMVLADQNAFEEFRRCVEAVPLSELTWEDFSNPWRIHGDVRRMPRTQSEAVAYALSYFVTMRQSRQGLGKDYCTPTKRTRRGMNENVSAWLTAVDGLPDVHERLRRVEVWHRPAIDAIHKLDGPRLLVYADPPYLLDSRASRGEYGEHEMSNADHWSLLDCLSDMRGRFMLSGYQNEMYDAWARSQGWYRTDFELPNNASGAKTKKRVTECVWTNFKPEGGAKAVLC